MKRFDYETTIEEHQTGYEVIDRRSPDFKVFCERRYDAEKIAKALNDSEEAKQTAERLCAEAREKRMPLNAA